MLKCCVCCGRLNMSHPTTSQPIDASVASTSYNIPQDEYFYFIQFAATVIQRHWRGYVVRRAYYAQKRAEREQLEAEQAALAVLQLHNSAARRIQLAWQSFRNKRIYQYYRDLIQFRERGDPREMLRAINPREASLLDAAAGAHVRFRLGGAMFPPLVFYKIFTHRPIADINAFGPRNYCSETSTPAKQFHSHSSQKKHRQPFGEDFEISEHLREYIKPDGTLGYRSTRGWYARVENNGWRPIAERVLLDEDPITAATHRQRIANFHYSTAVRREERLRRAKQRKREWLRKLYSQNCQLSVQDGTSHLPGSSLADLADEDLDDVQVDELLEWSQHLDYQSYVSDWTSMACTLGTESFLPETVDPATLMPLPAPSVSASAALAAAGVPLQPFKGGVTPAAGATSGLVVTC